jgi:chloramphenicol 3-O-phosphotransferase
VSADPRIIVISGLPGAGKSTIARLLGRRMPRAAHIEADELQRFVISGGVWPEASGIHGEAEQQLRLRLRNACLLARSFREYGFTAIVDDIVAGSRLDHVIEDLDGVPFDFVMLLPRFEVMKARWREMGSPFVDSWDWIDDEIRLRTRRVGLWLDTSALAPDETVEVILNRLNDATVGA